MKTENETFEYSNLFSKLGFFLAPFIRFSGQQQSFSWLRNELRNHYGQPGKDAAN